MYANDQMDLFGLERLRPKNNSYRSKKKGCPTCNGLNPDKCHCGGNYILTNFYSTDQGYFYKKGKESIRWSDGKSFSLTA